MLICAKTHQHSEAHDKLYSKRYGRDFFLYVYSIRQSVLRSVKYFPGEDCGLCASKKAQTASNVVLFLCILGLLKSLYGQYQE